MDNTALPHIRKAVLGDAGQIGRLAAELGYPATNQDIASRLEALLRLPSHFVAVAEDESALVGWVAVEERLLLVSGKKAELMGLIVAPAARRHGIGKMLVQAAECWALEQGFDAIMVRSNVARPESHSFYEDIGYTRNKTQHAYFKRLSSDPGSASA